MYKQIFTVALLLMLLFNCNLAFATNKPPQTLFETQVLSKEYVIDDVKANDIYDLFNFKPSHTDLEPKVKKSIPKSLDVIEIINGIINKDK